MEGFNNFSNERRRCVVCVTNVTVVSLNLILLRLRMLKLDAMSAIFSQYGEAKHTTVCPRSSDPFHIVSYYIKCLTTSWTYSSYCKRVEILMSNAISISPTLVDGAVTREQKCAKS